jgi:decaprenyl-phosphate phosphoribosyltransferase
MSARRLDPQTSPNRPEGGSVSGVPSPVAGGPARRAISTPLVVLRAARPRQWLKNLLVGAAPLAAGTLFTAKTAVHVVLALIAFCLLSSAGYLVNDVQDLDRDRAHPTKRLRPVAAGRLSVRAAVSAALVLALAGLGVAATVNLRLAALGVLYLAMTGGYSLGIKRQPVFDLALVAAGFLLRAIAGGLAAGVPLSQWFLLVTSFGSLFMVAGKRYADALASDGAHERAPAVEYSVSYLRFVWGVAAGATIMGYALWALQVGAARGQSVWSEVSVAPFVLAILRYAVDVDRGDAGAPEDVVLRDRGLLLLGLVWLLTFALAADVG